MGGGRGGATVLSCGILPVLESAGFSISRSRIQTFGLRAHGFSGYMIMQSF